MNASTFDTLSVARDLEAAGIERRHAEALRQAVSAGQHVSTDNASCTTITAIRISTAAPPLDSRPELARESTHGAGQLGDLSALRDGLASVGAVLPRMAVAERSAGRGSTVHPASAIRHRRGAAWRPSPRASAAPSGRVHGVVPRFRGHPLPPPPVATAPTIACPPSFTVTCSTRTVCCPDFPRWRFNASISAALVRLSRFA